MVKFYKATTEGSQEVFKFGLGDTVRLKSGGPIMTVSSCQDDQVTCQWFDNKKMKEAEFPASNLEAV